MACSTILHQTTLCADRIALWHTTRCLDCKTPVYRQHYSHEVWLSHSTPAGSYSAKNCKQSESLMRSVPYSCTVSGRHSAVKVVCLRCSASSAVCVATVTPNHSQTLHHLFSEDFVVCSLDIHEKAMCSGRTLQAAILQRCHCC